MQHDTQEAGSPQRMLLTEGQDFVVERVKGALLGQGRPSIGRDHGLGSLLLEAEQEVAHGADG